MSKAVHGLHTIMRQKRCGIGTLYYLCSIFKSRFGVSVFSQLFGGLFCHFCHFSQVNICTFKTRRNSHFRFTTPRIYGFFDFWRSHPLHFQLFAGIHHFPSRIAHYGKGFVESSSIKSCSFSAFFKKFNRKNIFYTTHFEGIFGIKRLYFHTKCRRMMYHRNQHPFLAIVHTKHRLTCYNFLTCYIFARRTDDFKRLYVFLFSCFRQS